MTRERPTDPDLAFDSAEQFDRLRHRSGRRSSLGVSAARYGSPQRLVQLLELSDRRLKPCVDLLPQLRRIRFRHKPSLRHPERERPGL